MFVHLPWGVGQLCFPPNKVPSHCRESHSCYWHKGLMGADCIRQPVLTLLFHGGGKHNSISLQPLWWDSSRPQKSHHLHLPVAKWHKTKGIKEKLSLRKTPYSHFPTLLSSSCIFSEENLFEHGTKSVWTVHDTESWENFTINLEWHKKRGKKKTTLGKYHTNVGQNYQTWNHHPIPQFFKFKFYFGLLIHVSWKWRSLIGSGWTLFCKWLPNA